MTSTKAKPLNVLPISQHLTISLLTISQTIKKLIDITSVLPGRAQENPYTVLERGIIYSLLLTAITEKEPMLLFLQAH